MLNPAVFEDVYTELTEASLPRWFELATLLALQECRGDPGQWGLIEALAYQRRVSIRALLAALDRLGAAVGNVELQSLTDLAGLADTRAGYLVDEFLPLYGLSILAGEPKSGKSTVARYIMRVVAGRPGSPASNVFGRVTKHGPVLYYVLEENCAWVIRDFKSTGHGSLPVYIRCSIPVEQGFIETLKADVKKTEAVLVVVDPLFDGLEVEDVNNYATVNRSIKRVVRAVREMSVHLMFVHHSNKSGGKGGAAILGSRAIEGATDVNIIMYRTEAGRRLLFTAPRYGEEIPKSYVNYTKSTGYMTLTEVG